MLIEKCKWKCGKQTAVMFMIDDFSNKYMTDRNEGRYLGADWGGRCKEPLSMYRFLEERLLKRFPELKLTLFLVTGARAPLIEGGNPSVARPIDANAEFVEFLQELSRDKRFEIAYHGARHGEIRDGAFKQEWQCFRTLDEACATIRGEQERYARITGQRFRGGKYCGYAYNEFSDDSISESGFGWWCRHWDGALLTNRGTGVENLELSFFGDGVVDIPSNIDGELFSLRLVRQFFTKRYLKAWYYKLRYHVTLEEILDGLVAHGQLLNIQEHSSPVREDRRRQPPNIIDDIDNLVYILEYLRRYDLWYATGSEIERYYRTYSGAEVRAEEGALRLSCADAGLTGEELWCRTEIGLRLKREDGEEIAADERGLLCLPIRKARERLQIMGG